MNDYFNLSPVLFKTIQVQERLQKGEWKKARLLSVSFYQANWNDVTNHGATASQRLIYSQWVTA